MASDKANNSTSSVVYRRSALIVSGMVMFVFITMHLINLSLGLHSVVVMDDWRWALSGIWSNTVLSFVLRTALFVHFFVALYSLYCRNTLKVPAYDMAQMVAGVMIVPLLANHVFGVMAYREMGLEPTYFLMLGYFWNVAPVDGLQQVVMLVVAWVHGAIGVYTWLRSKDGAGRVLRFFYPFAVALPILALLGFVEGGQQVIPVDEGGFGYVMVDDPNVNGPSIAPELIPQVVAQAKVNSWYVARGSLVLVLLVLGARWLRVRSVQGGVVRVKYRGERPAQFETETGLTLLEMAHVNEVPHANICRGRGRCGTCRVRVLKGGEQLPPPDAMEAKVLQHWHAGADERLACQLFPNAGDLEIERVVQADYSDLDYSQAGAGAKPVDGVQA